MELRETACLNAFGELSYDHRRLLACQVTVAGFGQSRDRFVVSSLEIPLARPAVRSALALIYRSPVSQQRV